MPNYCKHCKAHGITREIRQWMARCAAHDAPAGAYLVPYQLSWYHEDSGLMACGTYPNAEPYREPTQVEQDLELVRAEAMRMADPHEVHSSGQWYPRSRDALALLRTVVRLTEKGE